MNMKPDLSRMVGHNILNFDLPYLIRWSIYNGVQIPQSSTPFSRNPNGRYFPDFYIDTMQVISAGEYGSRISLDLASKACGYSGKNGSGKFFYQLNQDEKEEYLANDVRQTKSLFENINVSLGFTQKFTVFDIETAPKSVDDIEKIAPEFDPDSVKIGNLNDYQKIQEKIESARENHIDSIVDKAGLHAHYSDPIAIGYIHEDGSEHLDFSDPVELVKNFWELTRKIQQQMNN